MASTNKTANYELSQYVGSDKPTYLGDYNADMLKIDTAMKANNTLANTASTTATTASETASTALSNAGSAQTTANSANETATTALTKATANEANIAKFNLTSFTTYNASDMLITGGTLNNVSNITVACNADGSIAKIYGIIIFTGSGSGSGDATVTIQGTNLRPSENITINGNTLTQVNNATVYSNGFTVATNGNIVFSLTRQGTYVSRTIAINSLLFMTNFGDTPQE